MSGPRMAVVIPAGPADDVADTLASVLRWIRDPPLVVIVDDTGGALAGLAGPAVTVLPAPVGAPGGQGGLWVKLAAGLRHALDTAEFDLLLRLDADALLLGPGLAERAAARFAEHPRAGMLGSYTTGPDGMPRDWSPARRELAAEIGARGLRRPGVRSVLRDLYGRARAHGYELGAHALGGACLYRAETLRDVRAAGLLDLPVLARSNAGEDHLFGLVLHARGWRIADFGGPGDPLALRWKGLPAAPADLLARGALVTHSVRHWADLDETAIRGFFAARR
ncbi:glycosyltransferase [Actinocorallia sp. API 0066]|uniref:glycosyltransferase n=1 Tax=Actinocorallia sp. API 0066 TaxID=2896846 RepID=UPI001E5349CB|nr:glycosyltransferase [Actinocorallia sp. API 0066]MCD0450137.1 glycosyltransferase [Actinocorallia sp. API 0066]